MRSEARDPSFPSNMLGTHATGLMSRLRAHHPASWNHSVRVAAVAREIAVGYGLDTVTARNVCMAALTHDVGKIHVLPSILDMKEMLGPGDANHAQVHVDWGMYLLGSGGMTSPDPGMVAFHHHERWDGQGYPQGLSGRAIPFAARIVAVADSYDIRRSSMEQGDDLSHGRTMVDIRSGSGSHFDPEVIQALLRVHVTVSRKWELLAVTAGMP